MEMLVWIFCIGGCGITSYLIGQKEGLRLGAGLMYDQIVRLGSPKEGDPKTVIVELEKASVVESD
jgi:hypothetical protein